MKGIETNETYIYCLSDPNGDVKYVGKSDNPNRRYKEHLNRAKYKRYYKDRWVNSLLESSQKPEMIILDYVPYSDFEFWEDFYIYIFKIWGCKLTNTAPGGGGGNFGAEINKKISDKLRGRVFSNEWRENIRKARLGTKASDQTRLIFSSQRKGSNNSMYGVTRKNEWDANKQRKIFQLTLDGQKIKDWPSITIASKETGVNRTSINYVLINKRTHAGGYKWVYNDIY